MAESTGLRVIEICAGAGGQALGLESAGFEHELAVELDTNAVSTLQHNRPAWKVAEGDVADPAVWDPSAYEAGPERSPVDLLAGGVPCPPFTIAGKQLGATDERDLFAWAVEQAVAIKPRALLLENVRGLSMPRFAGYRQHVLDRLQEAGYMAEWRLLHASDYGVPQLRPRFVLIAMQPEDFTFFNWPEPSDQDPPSVGMTLYELMKERGWKRAGEWRDRANTIAPTIVGGSKKHGGADLGPTRAKRAWQEMWVDAHGIADYAPSSDSDISERGPKLTCEMVKHLQGWDNKEFSWEFKGRKTSKYRQIGNAFPPPVARALGRAIAAALLHEKYGTIPRQLDPKKAFDPIYRALRATDDFMTAAQIGKEAQVALEPHELEHQISLLSRDFHIEVKNDGSTPAYKLGKFKAFLGQGDHARHEHFLKNRAKIS